MVSALISALFGGLFGRAAKTSEREAGGGDDEPTPWAVAARVSNPVEEQIAVARLDDEGIPSRVRREAAGPIYGISVGILAEVAILVPEPLLEKARRILEDTMSLEWDEDMTSEEE